MIRFVRSNQVLEVNGVFYSYPSNTGGISKSIPCTSEVMGFFWMVPIVQGNRVIGYDTLNANSATKPSPDAVKILRVKDAIDANTEYGIAVLDADGVTSNTFVNNCNGCCGSTPVMPTVTIPTPILQLPAQTVVDGVHTFVFPFPANPNGLLYSIPFPWFNGAAGTPAYAPTGITTAAQFVTWADANWGAYGEWSSSGDIVTLASTSTDDIPVLLAGMQISLTPATFCLDFTAFSPPAAVNGIKFGTGATFAFSPFMINGTNQQTLINRIQRFIPDAVFTISTGKLQIATIQPVPKLYNDTTLVATAATGAC